MKHFVGGRDVFVFFPTDGGKSLCYASLPLVFDFLQKRERSISERQSLFIVVNPLIALIKDQVRSLCDRNVSAV